MTAGSKVRDLKNCRVLVTPRSYGETDPRLRRDLESAVGEVIYNTTGRPLTSSEVRDLLPEVDGYIAGVDIVDEEALGAAGRLRVISRYGVGFDKVDLAAAARRGIVVTNTPRANSVSVAELAIALMLALARSVPQGLAEVRAGRWPRTQGLTVEGKVVGLLGFGAIGKTLAERLRGWNCRVLAHDPFPDHDAAARLGVGLVSLEVLLREADFLSLHLPVLPETRRLVNAEFLSRMKPGAVLINTSRGELVDEAALAEAIRRGRLRGAGLDVMDREPPPPDNPLLRLPQVVITPHCASHTDGAMNAMGLSALNDCLAVLRGETPAYPVPPPAVE